MRKELLTNPKFRKDFEEYQSILHLLCRRFNRAVDELDIIRWLKNFEHADWEDALTVLNSVEYFDDAQILEAYDYCLKQVISKVPRTIRIKFKKGSKVKERTKKTKIVVVPIGVAGKSSSAMLYFLRKTQAYNNHSNRIKIIGDCNEMEDYKDGRHVYVFIDDYFGSGKSAVDFYNEKIVPKINKNKTYWISVISQTKAEHFMKEKIPNCKVISWRKRERAFLRNRSPFGSYKRMKYYRDFCYKYGMKLAADGPLGYENTQGMVTFSYGSPNNLLPIFWSSRGGWMPLFPRYSKDRMARSKEFRKETAYWLSLARILKLEIYKEIATGDARARKSNQVTYITKIDFQLFAIIRMLKQRRTIPVICQILGISSRDYVEVLQEGISRKLINHKGKLTEFGEVVYNEISRKVLEQKLLDSQPVIESSNHLYIPQSFRGKI
ncbi:hypothetical protein LT343_27500 [Bacillus toyonensis]|uniref:phosphoribosyltransferase-like protein n=1 Tax=Bacillus toyonensis TaxID=155322 RepID=UPI001EDF8B81|nr:hypothetical protein [Bacillus toyonensis]MCG3797042.1 hypothetical protein [Bacillus toyonensis]